MGGSLSAQGWGSLLRGPNECSGWCEPETAARAIARIPQSLHTTGESSRQRACGVYLPDGFARVVPLPGSATDRVVGGSCFHLKPVLAAIQSDNEFHLLTMSRKRAQLFRGSADRLTPAAVARMPAGVADPSLAQQHG